MNDSFLFKMENSWIFIFWLCSKCCFCTLQMGPDPWEYDSNTLSQKISYETPPDLRSVPKKNTNSEKNSEINEWFFKRILAIVLKGGQVKEEDNTIDVSVQMKFDQGQWTFLTEYLTYNKQFTEADLRRIIGYIEEAIYKPSIMETVVMTWNEYIQIYLTEYKEEITWIATVLTFKLTLLWLVKRMSYKHFLLMTFTVLYFYEVFISYKEAEQKDLERFLSAINKCNLYFWSSNCEIPPPDPLIFLKHMNPLKIGIRIFTTLISEPMILLSDTMKTITHGITDGLWYPLDKIMYGLLIVIFNTLLIFLFIMIFFNYILNIPFSLNFLKIIKIGVNSQENQHKTTESSTRIGENDGISGQTLEKLLEICSKALSSKESRNVDKKLQLNATQSSSTPDHPARSDRSASTRRLSYKKNKLHINKNMLTFVRKHRNGSGDA